MGRVAYGVAVAVTCLLAGCMPPAPHVEEIPEPEIPMMRAQQACEPVTKIVEVPVPVPMPGQLQQETLIEPETKPGKRKVTPVVLGGDTPGGFNSVQQYTYMEGALYQVQAAVGNATTILLAPGEYFNQAIIGDQSVWKTGEMTSGSEGTLRGAAWVSCSEAGKRTNMTITGSKHLYLLDLRCTEKTYHAAVHWKYPEQSGVGIIQGTRPSVAPQAPVSAPAPVTPDVPSTATYTLKSNRFATWQPVHVYDTGVAGKQTYIVFPLALASTDAPVLYTRSAEGTQTMVNYRVRQGYWIGDRMYPAEGVLPTLGGLGEPLTYYVLDGIADVIELRSGERKPTVVTMTRQQGL